MPNAEKMNEHIKTITHRKTTQRESIDFTWAQATAQVEINRIRINEIV
jgi:hypothetical protein